MAVANHAMVELARQVFASVHRVKRSVVGSVATFRPTTAIAVSVTTNANQRAALRPIATTVDVSIDVWVRETHTRSVVEAPSSPTVGMLPLMSITVGTVATSVEATKPVPTQSVLAKPASQAAVAPAQTSNLTTTTAASAEPNAVPTHFAKVVLAKPVPADRLCARANV